MKMSHLLRTSMAGLALVCLSAAPAAYASAKTNHEAIAPTANAIIAPPTNAANVTITAPAKMFDQATIDQAVPATQKTAVQKVVAKKASPDATDVGLQAVKTNAPNADVITIAASANSKDAIPNATMTALDVATTKTAAGATNAAAGLMNTFAAGGELGGLQSS